MQSTHGNHPSLKIIAAFDRGDLPAAFELVAPNCRAYVGSQIVDRDGWRQFGEMWFAAFPDTKHEVLASHLDGEYMTVVCKVRATHEANFMGVPATGRAIAMEVIHVDRVVDGRIVEHRGQFDSAGLMQQLSSPPIDHRAFLVNLFELIDEKKFEEAKQLILPNGRFVMGGQMMDRDGWTAFSQAFAAAFPDGTHVHDQIFSAGDRIVHTGSFEGTHRGDFQGIKATGRRVSFTYTGVMTLQNGKVLEERAEANFAGLVQQLTS